MEQDRSISAFFLFYQLCMDSDQYHMAPYVDQRVSPVPTLDVFDRVIAPASALSIVRSVSSITITRRNWFIRPSQVYRPDYRSFATFIAFLVVWISSAHRKRWHTNIYVPLWVYVVVCNQILRAKLIQQTSNSKHEMTVSRDRYPRSFAWAEEASYKFHNARTCWKLICWLGCIRKKKKERKKEKGSYVSRQANHSFKWILRLSFSGEIKLEEWLFIGKW